MSDFLPHPAANDDCCAEIFREAVRLHEVLGWNVIPIAANKKPSIRWKRWQTERQSLGDVHRMFEAARCKAAMAFAVIFGRVSGGLGCRDFDTVPSYERWRNEFPALAYELPTARTHRGFHVYCRSTKPGYIDLGDGEWRADGGHYCVCPPSLHPEGDRYGWIIPPIPDVGGNLHRRLNPDTCGFTRPWSSDEDAHGLVHANYRAAADGQGQGKSNTQESIHNPCVLHSGNLMEGFSWASAMVARVLEQTTPTGPGQRHNAILDLVRRLRGLPEFAQSEAAALEPVFHQWHTAALAAIRTKPFETSWGEFTEAWEAVKFPLSTRVPDRALVDAIRADCHPVAKRYKVPHLRLLVNVCAQLQHYQGHRPFFLSTRDAARLLGVDGKQPQVTAHRWLKQLQRDGVLTLVDRGTPGQAVGGRAASYCFIAHPTVAQPLQGG
jgi:hypothetical protein